jgi:hypothetical protein
VRLNCIDELFDESIFQQKQIVFFLNIAYYYVDWFDHQCFLVHVLYKILFFKTSYEHQDNVNKWHINNVFEEHSSIFIVKMICHEHDFILFDHHWIVKNIDQFMNERNLIYKSIQIINKWIITIWIVNHAFSKKIVKRFVNKHIRIFKWFQICHICKFNIRDILFCCFLFIVWFFVIFFSCHSCNFLTWFYLKYQYSSYSWSWNKINHCFLSLLLFIFFLVNCIFNSMIWSTYECDHIYFNHACIRICIVVIYRYFHADLNKSMTSIFSIETVIDSEEWRHWHVQRFLIFFSQRFYTRESFLRNERFFQLFFSA